MNNVWFSFKHNPRFGQTGSGKTHTMSGLFQRAAVQIFHSQSSVTLTAFEIAGKAEIRKPDIPWIWPPHSNSDHQDYHIFNRESL